MKIYECLYPQTGLIYLLSIYLPTLYKVDGATTAKAQVLVLVLVPVAKVSSPLVKNLTDFG